MRISVRLTGSGKAMIPPMTYLRPCPVEWKEPLLPLKVAMFRQDGSRLAPKVWLPAKVAVPQPSTFRLLSKVDVAIDLHELYDLDPGVYTCIVRYEFRANYPLLEPFHLDIAPFTIRFTVP